MDKIHQKVNNILAIAEDLIVNISKKATENNLEKELTSISRYNGVFLNGVTEIPFEFQLYDNILQIQFIKPVIDILFCLHIKNSNEYIFTSSKEEAITFLFNSDNKLPKAI